MWPDTLGCELEERGYRDRSRHPASCSCVACVEARAAGRKPGSIARKSSGGRKSGKKVNRSNERSGRRRREGASPSSESDGPSGIFDEVDRILGDSQADQTDNAPRSEKNKRRRKKKRKK